SRRTTSHSPTALALSIARAKVNRTSHSVSSKWDKVGPSCVLLHVPASASLSMNSSARVLQCPSGFKIRRPKKRVGSSPTSGTAEKPLEEVQEATESVASFVLSGPIPSPE